MNAVPNIRVDARRIRHGRCVSKAVAVLALLLTGMGTPRAQSCHVVMNNVNFGNIDTTSASSTGIAGTLDITCTGYATPYVRVCVSLGSAGGSWDPRVLSGPTATKLDYNLYKDPSYTVMWGSIYDPQVLPLVIDLPLSGGAGSTTAMWYARVFGAQTTVPAGAYSVTFATADTLVQAGPYTSTPPVCSTSGPTFGERFVFTVSATVVGNCTISADNINFGQHGFINNPTNTTGLITSTCTKGANYTLGLNAGTGAGATFAQRRMTRSGGSETLGYALYRDSGRTQIWGDGSGGSSTVSGTGSGATQTATVYATLPVQDTPPPGSYADTITVTVTF